MKIGLIVYSGTGHTLSVAEKLKDRLEKEGHSAKIERIVPIGEVNQPMASGIRFDSLPDLIPYEALIFAAPVQAFSLCSAMKAYFLQLSSIPTKKTACFTTQQLPAPWMGGNNAIRKMKGFIESKGGTVISTGIVNWSNKELDEQIAALVEKIGTAF